MLHSRLHPQTGLTLNGAERALYDAAWFETVFRALDRLHDEICANGSGSVMPLSPADMVGWLEDIIYTAQEAIVELQVQDPEPEQGVTTIERSTCN